MVETTRTTTQEAADPGAVRHRLAAGAARSIAAEYAEESDRTRRLPDRVSEAIVDAGFARHFVPRAFGGAQGTFTEFLRGASTVAEGCASAGWCASLLASHARMAAFLPLEGQRELWTGGPDTRISAGVVPSPDGSVAPADGGWTVSGSWSFVSGVDFADWVLLAGWEPEPEPDVRRLRFFAVPRSACAVDDTWFTVGMRGTGSRTVRVQGVFVPDHRSVAQQALLTGAAPGGTEDHDAAPCHSVPFRMVNGLTMVAPAVGAARGALESWSAWIARKTEMLMGKPVQAWEKTSVQAALARSAAAVDAAELLVHRIAARADDGGAIDGTTIARSHRDYAAAAEYVTDAVERIMRASGSRGQAVGSPIQRAWRDVHAAASHAALQFDSNAAVYAKHQLGEREQ